MWLVRYHFLYGSESKEFNDCQQAECFYKELKDEIDKGDTEIFFAILKEIT